MAVTQFSAPGRLTDFATPDQAKQWSDDVDRLFEQVIKLVTACVPKTKLQFVNPLKVDTSTFEMAEISWPGFPNSLLAEGGPGGAPLSQTEAYQIADMPAQRPKVQDEYLEWFIHREDGDIVAIDFTTETEHYWQSLFDLDPKLAASCYSKILGVAVQPSDISHSKNYNPTNPFNTSKGIVHLIHPSNTLGAELDIACQSTRLRTDSTGAETNDVVNCLRCRSRSEIGGASRNSDPKIANIVSIKADEGRLITIPDPVGLYIAKLDTSGWKTPDGSNPQDCWKLLRGNPCVRARFEVPGRKFKISDITIAGQPIMFAGQVAQSVFVKLTAALGPAGQIKDRPSSPCADAGSAHEAFSLTRTRGMRS
jgi:hypothetical protein